MREVGGFRDIGKLEIRILMVERDHGIAALAEMIDCRSVHSNNVEFPVIIAINQPDTSTHGFHDVLFFGRRNMRHC